MVTVNLRIVLTRNTPKNIVDWLDNNLHENAVKDKNYLTQVPKNIVENAPECVVLNTFKDDVDYSFKYDGEVYILILFSSGKNKNKDYEYLINFLTPYMDIEESLGFIVNSYSRILYKIEFTTKTRKDLLRKSSVNIRSETEKIYRSYYNYSACANINESVYVLKDLYDLEYGFKLVKY